MAEVVSSSDPAASLWMRVDASDLTKIWNLFDSVPVQVGAVANRLGLEVLSLTLPANISGLIKRTDSGNFQIHVNNTDVGVRQRFTVCHEIAHYLLHRRYIDNEGITDNILFRSKLSNKEEAEANKLGAAILLPWNKVLEWHQDRFGCEPNKDNIREIAAAFKASSLAVGFRLGV